MEKNYKNMDEVFEEIFKIKPTKRGKGFELLTAAVLKIINEAHNVTHDVRKTGVFSLVPYQIDVLVDNNGESLFVEAKDYSERNEKTGRGDAQKLAGALIDLDINKGMLVSATEFTKPTVQYSKSTKLNPNAKEINLCLLRPSTKKDTENLILEIVVNAAIQRLDTTKSTTNILLNQDSLKQAVQELKNEGVPAGSYVSRIYELFNQAGEHLAYIYDIITTNLPSEVEGKHSGTWRPEQDTYIKLKNKLIKVDGIEYDFVYIVDNIENFVHIKEEPVLTVKSDDLGLDYIITKRQLEGITFEPNGNILYREKYNN